MKLKIKRIHNFVSLKGENLTVDEQAVICAAVDYCANANLVGMPEKDKILLQKLLDYVEVEIN